MFVDRAFLSEIMARTAHTLPSYKVIKASMRGNTSQTKKPKKTSSRRTKVVVEKSKRKMVELPSQ